MKETKDCLLVKCLDCGRVVFMSTLEPRVVSDGEWLKEVGGLVKDGHKTERVTLEQARKAEVCECK